MKIELTESVAHGTTVLRRGTVTDVDTKLAKELIESGLATPVAKTSVKRAEKR